MTTYFLISVLLTLLFSCPGYKISPEPKKEITLNKGDTTNQVLESWGEPARRELTFSDGIRSELWIYDCRLLSPCFCGDNSYFDLPCYFLFFTDGRLAGWNQLE
jgi:hypothetical protein